MKKCFSMQLACFWLACIFLLAGSALVAQSTPAPDAAAPAPQDAKPAEKPGTPKIPRPNMGDESALQQPTFSQAVADALLRRLVHGMQGHNLPQTKSMFLAERLDPNFEQHMEAAFNYYDSFHLYYKIIQVSGEGEPKGSILADFDLESRPQQLEQATHRQHARLRLEVERVSSAYGNPWRIVAMDPEHFFFEY
ncbi:MAG TPA: hypothetical protein VFA71_12750 [Terriglobales bacterium]|nr:hypothetical protein [Terriglobales bacterium]